MGKFQRGSFRAVQEYFQRKSCRFCDHPFAPEGIQLLREEPGMLVVRVGCSICGRPLGVAIVDTGPVRCNPQHPIDWTKKDLEKFANLPAVSYDDVLNAHEFLNSVGSDWAKYLPAMQ